MCCRGCPLRVLMWTPFSLKELPPSQMVEFLKTLNLSEEEITQLSPKERGGEVGSRNHQGANC
jgi:hypothetical protein